MTLNINTSLALVNGAPTTTHSLTFNNLNKLERVQSLISGPNMKPFGSIITIEEPSSVNLKLNITLDNKEISTKRHQQLLQLQKISLALHSASPLASNNSGIFTIDDNWFAKGDKGLFPG